MLRRALTLITGVVVALALSSCRVDVTVDVAMAPDGTGAVTVTAVADPEVVAGAPGLAEDLRADDLVAAGWTVEGPVPTEDGGLRLVLEHPFTTPAEASALVASLNGANGPFQAVQFTRVESETTLTFTLDGSGRVDAGLAAFADPELLATVGATPYAAKIAEAALSPSQAMALVFTVSLPGTVESTTSTAEDGSLSWVVPLDGTSVPFATTTTQSADEDGLWAIVSTVALALLVIWMVVSVVFIGYVVYLRRRRRIRRGRGPGRPRHPDRASLAYRYDDVTPDP